MRRNVRDYIYVIFMGLILYLLGAIIIGGVSYFLKRFIGFDFLSVIVYYLISVFITRQIIKNIYIRNNFVSIYLPTLTGIMYVLSQFVLYFIILLVMGFPFKDIFLAVPVAYFNQILSYFTSFSLSVDGIFEPLINILLLVIEILIMIVGITQSYKVTRRE